MPRNNLYATSEYEILEMFYAIKEVEKFLM